MFKRQHAIENWFHRMTASRSKKKTTTTTNKCRNWSDSHNLNLIVILFCSFIFEITMTVQNLFDRFELFRCGSGRFV